LKLKDTSVIMFHGGTYGKYLYWVLNNFTTVGLQTDISALSDANGSSHNQIINNVPNPPANICDQVNWEKYKETKEYVPYYAHHLIEGSDTMYDDDMWLNDSWAEVDNISRTVNKSILIQSSPEFNLRALNNALEKTFPNEIDYFNIMNRFEDFKVDTSNRSAVREMLSYKLFYLGFRVPVQELYQKNVLPIDLEDILFSFNDTLTNILNFLETELTVSTDIVLKNHQNMISLQKHLHKDHLISQYLKCFIYDIPCSLPDNCSIIDEAYIQNYLRNELGLEIKCTGLDVFPSTAVELKKLTYPATEMTK